ncbi:MAG: hypothetical protein ACOC5T_08280 [Elusimicrobiota bacterium]
MDIVGIDKDDYSVEQGKTLKDTIEQNENCQVILYKTKHGIHLELLFDKKINLKENLKIREKYDDCRGRRQVGIKRLRVTGSGHDILFHKKNGFTRERVW